MSIWILLKKTTHMENTGYILDIYMILYDNKDFQVLGRDLAYFSLDPGWWALVGFFNHRMDEIQSSPFGGCVKQSEMRQQKAAY